MKIRIWSFLFLAFLFCFISCKTEVEPKPPVTKPNGNQTTTSNAVKVPKFSADSAYAFIQKQVDFGPRVPGTQAHEDCANWLEAKLGSYTETVKIQKSKVQVFNGKMVPMYNVIGSFNPKAKKRILISAHWDTRPFAEKDTDRKEEPIDGANDAGSGVGVILELARQLKNKPIEIGVDFVLFDVEDYGMGTAESWCLGSRYWSEQAKAAGYQADFGINLDMVGAKGAVFNQEGHSRFYANHIVAKVWTVANAIGYSSYFPFKEVGPITDDHLLVNQILGVPTIDIIEFGNHPNGFGTYHHTHKDNMDLIDKRPLKAVGQTVLAVLFNENR